MALNLSIVLEENIDIKEKSLIIIVDLLNCSNNYLNHHYN